jgi:hypothetical protein
MKQVYGIEDLVGARKRFSNVVIVKIFLFGRLRVDTKDEIIPLLAVDLPFLHFVRNTASPNKKILFFATCLD